MAAVTRLTGAARGAATVTGAVARHAVWYLRYRVGGSAQAQDARTSPPRERRTGSR